MTFANFTASNGLTHNRVECIYQTADGILWVGTAGGGICLYDGTTWTSLDTKDGLAGNNVSSIHQDAAGALWFATNKGVTRYRRQVTKPLVHIVSVKTERETADLGQMPELPAGNRVTIRYRATYFLTRR